MKQAIKTYLAMKHATNRMFHTIGSLSPDSTISSMTIRFHRHGENKEHIAAHVKARVVSIVRAEASTEEHKELNATSDLYPDSGVQLNERRATVS